MQPVGALELPVRGGRKGDDPKDPQDGDETGKQTDAGRGHDSE